MNGFPRYTRFLPRRVRPLIVGLACLSAPASLQGQQPGTPAFEGKHVFETICAACHTVGGGVKIGPDLKGVAERRTHDWLVRFIQDPERMFASGDTIASGLLAQYKVRMVTPKLTDQQVQGVIAFLSGGETPIATRPPLYLPMLALAGLLAAGFTLFAYTAARQRVETA